MENSARNHPLALVFFSLFVLLPGAHAADDQLRQAAKAYATIVAGIDNDLNKLGAMDQQCKAQDVVYNPQDFSSHYKSTARAFQGAKMAQMDQAVQQLGDQLRLGKQKLDETVQRINAARDAMEKLTSGAALKVSGVDACNGGDAAQDKVLATAQAQVANAKATLGLDARPKKQRISTIIETFKTLVSEKASQPDFSDLIKACTGPNYKVAAKTLQDGLSRLGELQTYAERVESSVNKMAGGLATQIAGMKKQGDCKSVTSTDPLVTDPKTSAKPASVTDGPPSPAQAASQRIAQQGTVYTADPEGVPAADKLAACYADPCSKSDVRAYQASINQYIAQHNLPITPIATDGIAGTQTANAWRAVMGNYNASTATGNTYTSWGATSQNTPTGVYYTFPPAKITSPAQLNNFFQ